MLRVFVVFADESTAAVVSSAALGSCDGPHPPAFALLARHAVALPHVLPPRGPAAATPVRRLALPTAQPGHENATAVQLVVRPAPLVQGRRSRLPEVVRARVRPAQIRRRHLPNEW